MYKRQVWDIAIYAAAVAAVVLVAVGAYLVEVHRPVHRVIESMPAQTASADHSSMFPPVDERCYRVNTESELYDLLRNEHGWKGTINPESVGENPTYPMRVDKMFYPSVIATNRFHHYAIYAQEIRQNQTCLLYTSPSPRD